MMITKMKPILKRFFTVLLASAAMIVVGAMLPPQLMTAAYAADGVEYIDADGDEQTKDGVTEITDPLTSLNQGWYVVKGTVNCTSSITLNGDVHLILADGATLNIGTPESRVNDDNGICGYYTIDGNDHSYSLTVYGQEKGTGALNVYVEKGKYNNRGMYVDSLTVNGGRITVDSSSIDAIIACNNDNNSGDPGVTVNGGELNANATNILGYYAVKCINDSKFIFNGGKVKATGTKDGIQAEGGYYLDYRSLSDEITVTSFSWFGSPADIVNIEDGKWFADEDGNAYSGSADITDKPITLRPACAVSIDGEISHGQVSANKAAAVSGNTVTLTVTPEDEYELDLLSVIKPGSGPVETTGSGNKYEFTMPGEAVTVYASFRRKRYSVIINGTSHGDVDVDNGAPYKGDTITLTATPDDGYKLDSITVTKAGGGTVETTGSGNKYEFTMPGEDVMVDATFIGTVSAPKFSPDGGTYTSAQNVTISSETPDADIFYTLDGSDPTATSGTPYSEPVSVTKTLTIKAIAVKPGMRDSDVSSATYTIKSDTPALVKYRVTVNYGTGDGEYEENETVTIKADEPAEGKVFDKWTSEYGVEFADAASPETTFIMPAKDVAVTATYKDKEQKEEDNPDPNKPEPDKTKVPVTDPSSSYASPEDNFAPVAPGASEGTGGNVKKLELDFSNVKGSGVATDGLKMTAIAGSKFTTKAKVKDKDSVHTEGGVKAKFNKKDSTATITCKTDGKATFETEDGSYTVTFKVDKPKPNKNEAKLSTGTAPVTKTVKDLFGTSINGGKLTILKEKVSGQAAVKDNELTVNPAEKDTIKLQYQYLNKKYKLTMKVK